MFGLIRFGRINTVMMLATDGAADADADATHDHTLVGAADTDK